MSFKEVSELSSKMDARSHLSFDHILLLALLHSTLNQSESIVFEWKRGGGGEFEIITQYAKDTSFIFHAHSSTFISISSLHPFPFHTGLLNETNDVASIFLVINHFVDDSS